MLLKIDQILNVEELKTIQQTLEKGTWESGDITAGSQALQVKNNQQLAEQNECLPKLRQIVLQALERSPLFFTATLPLKLLPPFFNRYADSTNAYGFHVDNAMRSIPQQPGMYTRADISATLFLSNPEDYEGGELIIQDSFGTHAIKLAAGSLLVYPSSSVHAVTPVTRGQRLACFMFIQSMVRDAGQRRLLYEMDMALLKLRQSIGETEPVVQLTGTYHNLLRQWAEN